MYNANPNQLISSNYNIHTIVVCLENVQVVPNSTESYFAFLLTADGVFGAMMQVNICNDGPVTVTLDSPQRAGPASQETTQENTES